MPGIRSMQLVPLIKPIRATTSRSIARFPNTMALRALHSSILASVDPVVATAAVEAPRASRALARPIFHLQPKDKGWVNDPNGIHFDPRSNLYHMFYQHYPTGSVWKWGLSWGHAVSKDLLSWHHLPTALDPTPGSADADGVWSGCAFPTEQGTVLLNTACKLRSNTATSDLPPPHLDLGLQMIESQTFATAQPLGDPLLRTWTKGEQPLLALPPRGGLTGWRDPFLVGRPGDGLHTKWTMLVGSGYDQSAGTAMVYTSEHPTSGWTYAGDLCCGDGSTGHMWECPLLAHIPVRPQQHSAKSLLVDGDQAGRSSTATHMFAVCPDNAHHAPVYFLGAYDPAATTFDLATATAAVPLDLGGPTFYAPNVLTNDPLGRVVMWGWCQELGRPPGEYDSACCLSVPRLLWRHADHPGRLWQEPLPSLNELRQEGCSWASQEVELVPGQLLTLPNTHTDHMEIEITLRRPSDLPTSGRPAKTGLLLPSHAPGPLGEASGRNGAALLVDWSTGRLDVVYSDGSVPLSQLASLPAAMYSQMNRDSRVSVSEAAPAQQDGTGPDAGAGAAEATPAPTATVTTHLHMMEDGDCEGSDEEDIERRALNIAGCHAVGGQLHAARDLGPSTLDTLTLRVFMDGSLMEVFTSTGEVLTARVYRDACPTTFQLASFGAASTCLHCAVHHMGPIWESDAATMQLEQQLLQQQQQASGAKAGAAAMSSTGRPRFDIHVGTSPAHSPRVMAQ